MIQSTDRLADLALLITYGAVAGFFFSRALDAQRIKQRRLASVAVALCASFGWFLLAAANLGAVGKGDIYTLLKWLGVGLGVFLLSRVLRTQTLGRDE